MLYKKIFGSYTRYNAFVLYTLSQGFNNIIGIEL